MSEDSISEYDVVSHNNFTNHILYFQTTTKVFIEHFLPTNLGLLLYLLFMFLLLFYTIQINVTLFAQKQENVELGIWE